MGRHALYRQMRGSQGITRSVTEPSREVHPFLGPQHWTLLWLP